MSGLTVPSGLFNRMFGHGTQRSSLLPLVLVVLTTQNALAQTGSYKYCCHIQKCKNVTAVCNNDPACASDCLYSPNSTFPASCRPEWSLKGKKYDCFSKYMDGGTSLINQVCGQQYDADLQPAPPAYITFGTCRSDCDGWTIVNLSSSSGSVTLLMQYILPAVVFCITIPRRRKWEVKPWFFEFGHSNLLKVPRFCLSLVWSAIVVISDMTVWVFTIFVGAGAIMVGAIMESVIDFEIIRHLEDTCVTSGPGPKKTACLTVNERIELIIVLVCGNLDRDIGNPDGVINRALQIPEFSNVFGGSAGHYSPLSLQTSQTQLRCILWSQATFGSLVGAPVLFFIGAFAVTLDSLSDNVGDNESAHSLAFGMWWAVIVHVAIVSSFILASNNPSTINSIVAFNLARRNSEVFASPKSEDRQIYFIGMTPVFESPFMPVTLWDRGRMKKRWLESTSAWKYAWFRERVQSGISRGRLFVPFIAFILIFIPTSFAFIISYTTPKICVGCRALIFIVYTSCQMVIILASTWWTYNSEINLPRVTETFPTKLSSLSSRGLMATLKYFVSGLFVITALVGSLFTSFAGTLLELLGTFSNCVCSIPASRWLSPDRDFEVFNIASDTEEHRMYSKYWSACGYATIAFMAVITFLGWWYQRVLRWRLFMEIDRLSDGHRQSVYPLTTRDPFRGAALDTAPRISGSDVTSGECRRRSAITIETPTSGIEPESWHPLARKI